MVSVKDVQDAVDELKGQASKRAADLSGLLGEGRGEVRKVVGGHSDGTVLAMLGLGILLGAITGAALALLFTPFSGTEARRRIGESVEKVRTSEPAMTNGSPRRMSSVGSPPYVSS